MIRLNEYQIRLESFRFLSTSKPGLRTKRHGVEETVHVDQVLEYNRGPRYLSDLLIYKRTIEARKRVAASPLSKREIIRRLGISATQLYQLLDQRNCGKTPG